MEREAAPWTMRVPMNQQTVGGSLACTACSLTLALVHVLGGDVLRRADFTRALTGGAALYDVAFHCLRQRWAVRCVAQLYARSLSAASTSAAVAHDPPMSADERAAYIAERMQAFEDMLLGPTITAAEMYKLAPDDGPSDHLLEIGDLLEVARAIGCVPPHVLDDAPVALCSTVLDDVAAAQLKAAVVLSAMNEAAGRLVDPERLNAVHCLFGAGPAGSVGALVPTSRHVADVLASIGAPEILAGFYATGIERMQSAMRLVAQRGDDAARELRSAIDAALGAGGGASTHAALLRALLAAGHADLALASQVLLVRALRYDAPRVEGAENAPYWCYDMRAVPSADEARATGSSGTYGRGEHRDSPLYLLPPGYVDPLTLRESVHSLAAVAATATGGRASGVITWSNHSVSVHVERGGECFTIVDTLDGAGTSSIDRTHTIDDATRTLKHRFGASDSGRIRVAHMRYITVARQ